MTTFRIIAVRPICEFDKRRASQRQSLWLVAGVLAFCAFAVGIAVLLMQWMGYR